MDLWSTILTLVLCLFKLLEEEESSEAVLSMTAFKASWMESMECWPPLESSSPVMRRTFFMRPPSVVISALSVLRWRAFNVLMRSGRRSDRSSQQREALIINLPSSSVASMVSSSASVGRGLSSPISEVWRFSSLTCWITSANKDALSVCNKVNYPRRRV